MAQARRIKVPGGCLAGWASGDPSKHPADQDSQILHRREWLLQSIEMGDDMHGFPMCDNDILGFVDTAHAVPVGSADRWEDTESLLPRHENRNAPQRTLTRSALDKPRH